MEKIKILSTIGPASIDKETLLRLQANGVDIFRINLSHTKEEDFEGVYKKISSVITKTICIDSEGAQIRTGKMKDGKVNLENNSVVNLVSADKLGDAKNIPLYPIEPEKLLKLGDILYLDFHNVILQVIKITNKNVEARVLEGGDVGSNKGVNLDRPVDLPAFTKKDLAIFKKGIKHKINCVALSFCSKKQDVENLRKIFPYKIFVVSKIESKKAIANLEEICKASDAVLIDRGDLSRDIHLQKIGLAQKHVLETAKKIGTPVYIATNLLETMIENFQPTRAEVNDITSALMSGASGLVLAAETAIGKHPVESARVVRGIIEEVKEYKKNKTNYLNSIFDYSLIEPHGGVLVQNLLEESSVKNLASLKKVKVSEQVLLDAVQIAEGVYSPIKGFMGEKELLSVLDKYKLLSGVVWTLPILFQAKQKDVKKGQRIALQGQDGVIYAIMDVSEVAKIDLNKVAQKWFGTNDTNHPGVKNFIEKGEFIIAGEVFLLKKPAVYTRYYNLSPRQSREVFKNYGWQKIVGFHTRNVIHKGHEFIQQQALRQINADALFISPVVGPKKKNDFTAEAIINAYEIMVRNGYYKPYPAVIGSFATYSRYSGPREAVFTALCRKNFGCSHFVVGRDHTGVGNYYPPDASQKIFEKLGDIGIKPLFFDAAYFCKKCGQVQSKCSHGKDDIINISGTKARECLLNNQDIPEYMMRKDISSMLREMYNDSTKKLFETGQ